MKTCEFEGCSNRVKAKGLCSTHYNQAHSGMEMRPIGQYKMYSEPAPGKKICTRCECVKSKEEDFYDRGDGSKNSVCKACMIVANSEYRRRNAAELKAYRESDNRK